LTQETCANFLYKILDHVTPKKLEKLMVKN